MMELLRIEAPLTPETASFFRFSRFRSSRCACFLISCTIGRSFSGMPETRSTGISCLAGVRPSSRSFGSSGRNAAVPGRAAGTGGTAAPGFTGSACGLTRSTALPILIFVPNGISYG